MIGSVNSVVLAVTLSMEERLALAGVALAKYRAACFWWLAPAFQVTEETLPIIIAGLCRHGDRAAYLTAARLDGACVS